MVVQFLAPFVPGAATAAATAGAVAATAGRAALAGGLAWAGRSLAWLTKATLVGSVVGLATYAFAPQIVSAIGGILLNLTVYFLIFAGKLFNILIDHAIVDFPNTLNVLGMTGGINTVWTVFRDISNIVIIGMFVFIAISIILGNQEYGQKKLVANVLIIAVLINFSLLFTKMVIDAGNFTAYQFYKSSSWDTIVKDSSSSVSAPGATPIPASASFGGLNSPDISATFMKIIGVTGLWDTFGALEKNAEANGSWSALGWSFAATALLLMAVFVFLYGSFIIVARAMLLVFVMITAPLAFASHLIPGIDKSEYGWSAWWKSLIKGSLFAPLLMIFLWASVSLLSTAGVSGPAGTIGGFLTNPASTDGWRVMVVYFFTIALLFMSIKLSSQFATTIGGFNLAQLATAIPFAAGSRLAAMGLRNAPWLGGRGSAIRSMDLEDAIKAARTSQGFLDGDKKARAQVAQLMRQKDRADWRSKGTYDLMNTGLAQTLAKSIGLSGMFADKTKTNFADTSKARADAAAKSAAAASVSKADADKFMQQQVDTERKRLELDRVAKRDSFKLQRRTAEETIRREHHGDNLADAKKTMEEGQKEIVKLAGKLANGSINRRDHDINLRAETDRINTARAKAQRSQAEIDRITAPVVAARKELTDVIEDIKKLDDVVREGSANIVKKSTEAAHEVAAQLAHGRISNILPRIFGEKPENDVTSRKARKLAELKIKAKGAKARQTTDNEILADANEPTTP